MAGVIIGDNESFESASSAYRCQQDGILPNRRREHYEKPSVRRRRRPPPAKEPQDRSLTSDPPPRLQPSNAHEQFQSDGADVPQRSGDERRNPPCDTPSAIHMPRSRLATSSMEKP